MLDIQEQLEELLLKQEPENLGRCYWCFAKASHIVKGDALCEAHYQAEVYKNDNIC